MYTHKKTDTAVKVFLIACIVTLSALFIMPSAHAGAATKTTLKTKTKTMYVNGSYTIAFKNKISKATYFYTSNKTEVANVSSTGKVTGIGKGSARIKVRYKYKGIFHNVGTLKVTVKKATLKSTYQNVDAVVGDTITPSMYLNNVNSKATYSITLSSESVASVTTEGAITAVKAGSTTLSIHEIFNSKSRTIGVMSMTVTGASLKFNSVKMAYLTQLETSQFINDIDSGATYTLSSDNAQALSLDDARIISVSSETYDQTCNVTITETSASNVQRVLGTIKVELTNSPFVSVDDQDLYIGLGATLDVGSSEGITITNQNTDATYTVIPADNTIISTDMIATSYGTTTAKVTQTVDGNTTTLAETVKITVTTAYIKDDLSINGFSTTVDGDVYGDYPVECRNHNKTYYYESADKSVCTASTGGSNEDQDYLLITPIKIGQTSISVYETTTSSSARTKVGSFKVSVSADNGDLPDLATLTASKIINSISFTHNNKTVSGNVGTSELACTFYDSTGGYIDYGTDFSSLTSGSFTMILKKSRYYVESAATSDGGYTWNFTINLGDEDGTLVNVPVTLAAAKLDTTTLFDSITVGLKTASKKVTSITSDSIDFGVTFTSAQYIAAGATEYSTTSTNPVLLSSLSSVSCTVKQLEYSSASEKTQAANVAIAHISTPTSSNNKVWNFTVTFEDGSSQAYTVTLGLQD